MSRRTFTVLRGPDVVSRQPEPADAIVTLAGFPVRKTTALDLSTLLRDAMAHRRSSAVFFANTNLIMQCQHLLPALRDDRVTLVNDGIGLSLAALLFRATRFPENLNGTDFTPYLLGRAATPLRIFLLGGRPAVLAKASEYVRDVLGQRVVGAADGYRNLDDPQLIESVRAATPDLVLVALGNPLQEAWILRHRDAVQAGALMGVGALFDFWAGEKARAPRWIRAMRLEWLFRLALEPRRLSRRYTVDIVRFLWTCYRDR